jgi:hypothetical protein
LSLKFIVHFGNITETRIASFIKASGIDMVIAHRLLKNKIEQNEYVLITKKFLNQAIDHGDSVELKWNSAKENYVSIGDIDFDYAALDHYREEVMTTSKSCEEKLGEKVYDHHIEILAYYHDVFGHWVDLPMRMQFVPGMEHIEFMIPVAAIGMPHTWQFANHAIEAIPMGIDVTSAGIVYWEEIRMIETGDHAIVEYVFDDINKTRSHLGVHLYKVPGKDLPIKSINQLAMRFDGILGRMKEVIRNDVTPSST